MKFFWLNSFLLNSTKVGVLKLCIFLNAFSRFFLSLFVFFHLLISFCCIFPLHFSYIFIVSFFFSPKLPADGLFDWWMRRRGYNPQKAMNVGQYSCKMRDQKLCNAYSQRETNIRSYGEKIVALSFANDLSEFNLHQIELFWWKKALHSEYFVLFFFSFFHSFNNNNENSSFLF